MATPSSIFLSGKKTPGTERGAWRATDTAHGGHKEVDATEYTGTGGAQLYFTAEEH